MSLTRTRTEISIATETGKETRDAKGTATGTARETGTVTDGTLVCLSPVIIDFAIADNYTVLILIAARSRRGGGGGGDHWEPEDRERRNDVRSLVLSLHFASYPYLVFSVDGARAHVRHTLALALLPAHGVARLRLAAVVRAVRDPVAALRAAVHATAIASRRKHSRALLAGR